MAMLWMGCPWAEASLWSWKYSDLAAERCCRMAISGYNYAADAMSRTTWRLWWTPRTDARA